MSNLISRKAAIDNDINVPINDTISRQAAIRLVHKNYDTILDFRSDGRTVADSFEDIINALPPAQQEPKWIPVKMRPMDEEEREYWEDHFGYELADEDAVLFDCQMPNDGQEILVSYRKWICMDKCEIDCGCYGLEGNGDWDGVVAWMELPEAYKEGE